ncbi:unnamed protein product [Rhizophagus irregularis]|nr:unnamed protein product [Rhizophagus irregularis]
MSNQTLSQIFKRKLCEKCGRSHMNNLHNWCIPCQIHQEKDCSSGNEKIDYFIQNRQLNSNNEQGSIFEWVPYNQLIDIKKIKKYDFATIYSAKWKDGPLYWDKDSGKHLRKLDVGVILKCLHNLQNNIDQFLDVIGWSVHANSNNIYIYGMSQNPDTNDYFMIIKDEYLQSYCVTCGNSYNYHRLCNPCLIKDFKLNFINRSGNEKVNNFIQGKLIKSIFDPLFEWIPYNQFNEIKEISKGERFAFYSAEWKDGPVYFNEKYLRMSDAKVVLKYLHDSQNTIDQFLNEVKQYLNYIDNMSFDKEIEFDEIFEESLLYGISQKPDTKDYLMVLDDKYFRTYCVICGEKYSDYKCFYDMIFEWIPFSQFSDIKQIIKSTIYSAIWENGPLHWNTQKGEKYIRQPSKKVALKYLYNSQNDIDEFLNEIKQYAINSEERIHKIVSIYGISQDKDTNNYLLVLNDEYFRIYCEICGEKYLYNYDIWCKSCHMRDLFKDWTIGNTVIDNLIQEMQLKIDNSYDIFFEWIPYNQFDEINEIGKGGFATVYSAKWKSGPLRFNSHNIEKYVRQQPNMTVALKCLHDSQNITNKFLNEVKEYSINQYRSSNTNILKIYGISQNPNSKEYIIVLEYAKDVLLGISNGLKNIHQKQMVHRDLHTGNILFFANSINFDENILSISYMGLCGKIDNIDETNVYGVMPYVASEVLRGKSYTQAADIYSFGMIMYFVATGKQPFADRAHDESLALEICEGIRPEINELEVPKIYVDLMKKCWDLNPDNRPNSIEIYDQFIEIIKARDQRYPYAISNENKTTKINENEITKINAKAHGYESPSDCLDCQIE